jgi:hypothetical protein
VSSPRQLGQLAEHLSRALNPLLVQQVSRVKRSRMRYKPRCDCEIILHSHWTPPDHFSHRPNPTDKYFSPQSNGNSNAAIADSWDIAMINGIVMDVVDMPGKIRFVA